MCAAEQCWQLSFHLNSRVKAVSIPLLPCPLPQVAGVWKRLKCTSCSLATFLTPPFSSFPACLFCLWCDSTKILMPWEG